MGWLRQPKILRRLHFKFYDKVSIGQKRLIDDHVDKRDIKFTILAGSKEISEEKFTLKNMKTGEQEVTDLAGLIKLLT